MFRYYERRYYKYPYGIDTTMRYIKISYWSYIFELYDSYNNYKPKCKYYIITYYILKYMHIKLKVYNFG